MVATASCSIDTAPFLADTVELIHQLHGTALLHHPSAPASQHQLRSTIYVLHQALEVFRNYHIACTPILLRLLRLLGLLY